MKIQTMRLKTKDLSLLEQEHMNYRMLLCFVSFLVSICVLSGCASSGSALKRIESERRAQIPDGVNCKGVLAEIQLALGPSAACFRAACPTEPLFEANEVCMAACREKFDNDSILRQFTRDPLDLVACRKSAGEGDEHKLLEMAICAGHAYQMSLVVAEIGSPDKPREMRKARYVKGISNALIDCKWEGMRIQLCNFAKQLSGRVCSAREGSGQEDCAELDTLLGAKCNESSSEKSVP